MTFVAGCVGVERALAVIAQSEDDDGEPLDDWRIGFWRDGEWRAELPVAFALVAVAPVPDRHDAWVALGNRGEILWIDHATGQRTVRQESIDSPSTADFIALRPFGHGFVATQMGRRVFASTGSGWSPLGNNLPPHQSGGDTIGFLDLAQCGTDLVCCGWKGDIWRLRENLWMQEDSPTNIILTSMTVRAPNDVLVCGRLGIILRGCEDQWARVDHQQTDEDFWSIVTFCGRIYLASLRGIYELLGDELLPVDDEHPDAGHHKLYANDEIMLSLGSRTLLVTDGEQWTQIL
jgi:hypothetical protein